MKNLPTDLLRTFVGFADAGSLSGAARHVGRSTSAVSLQLKQLQGLLDAQILEKSGRRLVLTSQGRLLLAHARRILAENDRALAAMGRGSAAKLARLGLVQDLAGDILADLIRLLAETDPDIELTLRVGQSSELVRLLGEDALDVALVAWIPGGSPALCSWPMAWFGQAALAQRQILPLALVSKPCPFWTAAEAALHGAERDFSVALETPSLDGVRAGVRAGLGIGCRTVQAMGSEVPQLRPEAGLPALPEIAYTALARPRPTAAAKALHDLCAGYLSRLC